MGSVRRLLLVAALALAIAADARADVEQSTLTLSPVAGSLITTRDDPHASSITTVIGSAASDSATKVTDAPATETPTTAPPTVDTSSESEATSASDSGEQDTTDAPASASATVSPGSTSDRSTLDSEEQTDATAAASASASSRSSTASVDTLNDSGGGLSTGGSSSMGTILPAVFGALACVGAIVMAVTYKKKRDSNGAGGDCNRPSSDCGYTSGVDFTPDNRTLSAVQEDNPPVAVRVPVLSTQSSAAPAAIADFTGTNSSVSCSSPFGSTRCKVRVSSPVTSCYSSSEANMEFQDTCPRHEEGSNVVLTFDEVPSDSKHAAPQVQL
ncbi:hypothetical protein PHYPSEUDO_004205 [Phytophthora pseudosyringae]|uniref:Uncharacterized protein n=1 Tax=Phytophthora pseudosyringae TaxID=221518 RepID=A0A8T1VSN8_9STRA|nr:hypothetical protein PHYPSEUDO_004205 [Phytophthora pseudosyringae]